MTNNGARNRQSAGQPTGGQFATEAELLSFVERGGYTQTPPMGMGDPDHDMLETEAKADPIEPVVEERRLMVPHTAPALDGEREDAERGYIEAAAGLAVNEMATRPERIVLVHGDARGSPWPNPPDSSATSRRLPVMPICVSDSRWAGRMARDTAWTPPSEPGSRWSSGRVGDTTVTDR